MNQQIRELIGANLVDNAGRRLLKQLTDKESLIDAGLLDSLGIVQLVALLERTFQLTFEPLDISAENLESVARITALVELRRGR